MIWQNRKCKIEDGVWMISRMRDHDDFNFGANYAYDIAVAGSLPGPSNGKVAAMVKIDEERLLLVGDNGTFWLLTATSNLDARIDAAEAI